MPEGRESTAVVDDLLDEIEGTSPSRKSLPVVQAPFGDLIQSAASRHGVPPDLVSSIIARESSFNPKAVSPKGAVGLMQLMPGTAQDMGVEDPFDPEQNIEGGTRYLSQLMARYKGDSRLAVAAYNSGPENVDKAGGVPGFPETQKYVQDVLSRAPAAAQPRPGSQSSGDPVQDLIDELGVQNYRTPPGGGIRPSPQAAPAGPQYEPPSVDQLITNVEAPAPLSKPTTEGYPPLQPSVPAATPTETAAPTARGMPVRAWGGGEAVPLSPTTIEKPSRYPGAAFTGLMEETRNMASLAFDIPYGILTLANYATSTGADTPADLAAGQVPANKILELRDALLFPNAETDRLKAQAAASMKATLDANQDLPDSTKAYLQKQIADLQAPVPPRNAMEYLENKYGKPQSPLEYGAQFLGKLPLYMEEVNPAMIPLNLGGRAVFKWLTPKAAEAAGTLAEDLMREKVIYDGTQQVANQAEQAFKDAYWPKVYDMVQEAQAEGNTAKAADLEEAFRGAMAEHVSNAKSLAEGWIIPQAEAKAAEAGWAATATEMGPAKLLAGRATGAAAEGLALGAGMTRPVPGEPPESYAKRAAVNAFVTAPTMGAFALGGEALSELIRVGLGGVPRAYALGPIVRDILTKVQNNGGPESLTPPEQEFLQWIAEQVRRKGVDVTVNGRAEPGPTTGATSPPSVGPGAINPDGAMIPYSSRAPMDKARGWIPWITEQEIQDSGDLTALINVAKARRDNYMQSELVKQATPEELAALSKPGAPRLLILKGIEDRLATPPPSAIDQSQQEPVLPPEIVQAPAELPQEPLQPTEPSAPSEEEFGAAMDILKGFLAGPEATTFPVEHAGPPIVPAPSWAVEAIDRAAELGKRLGIDQDIIRMASTGQMTARQIGNALAGRMPGLDPQERDMVVRGVRTRAGIGSLDEIASGEMPAPAAAAPAVPSERAPAAPPTEAAPEQPPAPEIPAGEKAQTPGFPARKPIQPPGKGMHDLQREDFVKREVARWEESHGNILNRIAGEGGISYGTASDMAGKEEALALLRSSLNHRFKRSLVKAGSKKGIGTDVIAEILQREGLLDVHGMTEGSSAALESSLVQWLMNKSREYSALPETLGRQFDEAMTGHKVAIGDLDLKQNDIVQLGETEKVPADRYRVLGTAKGVVKLQDGARVDLDPFDVVELENHWPGGKPARRPKGGAGPPTNLGEETPGYGPDAFDSLPQPVQEALVKAAKFIQARGMRSPEQLAEVLTTQLGTKVTGLLPGLFRKLGIGVQNVQQAPPPTLPAPGGLRGVGGPPAGGTLAPGPGGRVAPATAGPPQQAQGAPPARPQPVVPPVQGAAKPSPAPGPGKAAQPAKQPKPAQPPKPPAAPSVTRQTREGGIATISRELMPDLPQGFWQAIFPAELVDELGTKFGARVLPHQVENAVRALKAFGWDPSGKALPDSRANASGHSLLIADSPGTGKTRSAALVVDQFLRRNPKARIVAIVNNQDLMKQWKTDGLDPLGIRQDVLSKGRSFRAHDDKTVNFMTYARLRNWKKADQMGLLEGFNADLMIFDECQAFKNWYQGVLQARAGEQASRMGKNVLFLSATPFESILHMGYLSTLKLWPYGAAFDGWLNSKEVYFDSKKGTWSGLSPTKLKGIHGDLVRGNRMVKSDVDFHNIKNSNGENITLTHMHRMVPMTEAQLDEHTRIADIFESWLGQPDVANNFIKRKLISSIRYLVFRSLDEYNKLPAAIEIGKQALAQGKTVIFTMLRKGDIDFEDWWDQYLAGDRPYTEGSHMPEIIAYLKDQGIELESPVRALMKEFPEFAEITGNQPSGSRARADAIERVQKNEAKGAVVTMAAGGVGLSFQDKDGKFPRLQVNLTAPDTAMMMTQVEGRSFRLGSQSNADIMWLFTDTPMDRKIARKVAARAIEMGAVTKGITEIASAEEMLAFEFPELSKSDIVSEDGPVYSTDTKDLPAEPTREESIAGRLERKGIEPFIAKVMSQNIARGERRENLMARGRQVIATSTDATQKEIDQFLNGQIESLAKLPKAQGEQWAREILRQIREGGNKAPVTLSEDQQNLFGQQGLPLEKPKQPAKPEQPALPGGTFQPSTAAQIEALRQQKRSQSAIPPESTGGPLFESAEEAEFKKKQMSLMPELQKPALPLVRSDESYITQEVKQTGRFYPLSGKEMKTEDVAAFFDRILKDKTNENVFCLYARDGKPLGVEMFGFGRIDTTRIEPRILMRGVASTGANEVWMAHNHPSGTPTASRDDQITTDWARMALKQAGVEFKGHIIVDLKQFGLIPPGGQPEVRDLPQTSVPAGEMTNVPELAGAFADASQQERARINAASAIVSPENVAAAYLTAVKDRNAPSTALLFTDAQQKIIGNLILNAHLSALGSVPGAAVTIRRALAKSFAKGFFVVTNEVAGVPNTSAKQESVRQLLKSLAGPEFGEIYSLIDVLWVPPGGGFISLHAFGGATASLTGRPQIWEPTPRYLSEPSKIRRTEREMIKALSSAVATPIRFGRMGAAGKRALGFFRPYTNVIRMRSQADLPTAFHELGHRLDQLIFGSEKTGRLESVKTGALKKWRNELAPLAQPGTTGPILQEGLAEFVRHYMEDPGLAQRVAPSFFKWFDEDLLTKQMPRLKRELMGIRSDYQLFQSAEPWDRVASTQRSGLTRGGGAPAWLKPREWTRALFDTMEPIRKMVKDAEALPGGHKVPAFKDPGQLVSLLNGWANPAAHFIRHGTFPWNNPGSVNLGPGLEQLIRRTPGDRRMFEAYGLARYALALVKREHQAPEESTGITLDDAKATFEKFHQKYAEHYRARVTYARHIAQILRDSGFISDKTFHEFPSVLGEYYPLWRILDDVPEEFSGRSDVAFRMGNLYQPIKRRRGGTAPTLLGDEALARMTFLVFRRAHQNAVGQALVDISRSIPGMGEMVEEVPQRLWPTTLKVKEVLSKLHIPAGSVDEDLAQKLITIFRPSWFQPPPGEMWVWMPGGQRVYIKVRPDVYGAMMSLDRAQLNPVVRAAGAVTRLKRAGAAIFSPTFMVGRIPMNVGTALIQSDKPLAHAAYLIPSLLAALVRHGKLPGLFDSNDYWKFMASGGGGTFFRGGADQVIGEIRRNMEEAQHPVKYWLNPVNWFTKSLAAISYLGSALELMPRIAEARVAGLREAQTRSQTVPAAVKGRENPADYQRLGYITAFFNHMTAFFGPNLAHMNRTYREFKEHPGRIAFRMALLVTATMLYYMAVRDDENWKKLDRRIKDGWFVIPLPGGDWVRIRKPGWFGTLMSLAERTMESMDLADHRPLDEWGKEVLRHVPLPVPDVAMPIAETAANYSYFFGRKIHPERGEPGEQGYPYNTPMAWTIGRLLNYPPANIDYMLDSWSGGLWSTPPRMAQSVESIATGQGQVGTGWSTMPPLRGLFYPQLVGESDTLKEFYEKHWIPAQQAYQSFTEKKSEGAPEAREYLGRKTNQLASYFALRKVAASLDVLQDAARSIRNNDAMPREEKEKRLLGLRQQMDSIAAKANVRARFITGGPRPPQQPPQEPVLGSATQ